MVGRPSAWQSVEVDREARRIWAPKAAIAHILGANPSWLSSLQVEPDAQGRLDLRTVARRFVEHREAAAERRGAKAERDDNDLNELRKENLRQRIRTQELDNLERERMLIDAEALGQVWQRALGSFRSALEAIPRKLAAVEGVSAEVERECARLVAAALEGLADLELVDDDDGSGEEGGDMAHEVAASP